MLMQLLYLFTDFSFYSIVTVIIFVIGPLAVDQLYSPTLLSTPIHHVCRLINNYH